MDWFLIVIMSFLAVAVFASIFEPPTPISCSSEAIDRLD